MTGLFVWRCAAVGVASAAVLLSGCRTSGDPRQFAPAVTPYGVAGTVQVAGGANIEGELLAVSDTAYLMLAGSRVVIAPYAVVTRSRFAYVGAVTRSLGETPSGKRQRQAVLYSRFPYGIPESALSALLTKSGQSAPDNARTVR